MPKISNHHPRKKLSWSGRLYLNNLKPTERDIMIDGIKTKIDNFEDWFYPVYAFKSSGNITEYDRLIKEKYEEFFPLDS